MAVNRQDVDGFLFDLNGVFYVGDEHVSGAVEVLQALDERQLPYAFITNTTTQSRADLAKKLHGLGLKVDRQRLVTAPVATRDYLKKQGLERCCLVSGNSVKEDFEDVDLVQESPDAVVVGDIGNAWDYPLLDRLFRMLADGAELVAMHKNRYSQGDDGLHMDIGPFVAALEYAADTEAVVTGKPEPAFFDAGAEMLGLDPERIAVVGDDIDSDVGGAQAAGMKGVLVQTGKYREDLVAQSTVTPDAVLSSIADLTRWWRQD